MSADPLATRTDELIELAQSGGAAQALAQVDLELAADGEQPALHFAKAVALHALADPAGSAAAAGAGVAVATAAGRNGWRAALLAMRALQLLGLSNALEPPTRLDLEDPDGTFEEGAVVRDLAEAQVAMARGVADVQERIAAHCALAEAYAHLRLYELAVPMYLGSFRERDAAQLAPEAPVVQQLNLCTLHLTWACELLRVGLEAEAAEHCGRAAEHAATAARVAAGEHGPVWAARARLFASTAASQVAEPGPAVAAADRELDLLRTTGAGVSYEQALTAPMLALAERRSGRTDRALARIGAAVDALEEATDPLVVAATRHAHLVLLADTDPGARAGLSYGEALSVALWRQRARRLSAAEEVLRYERLRLDHEEVSRTSDIDALTGAATRRGFDRRLTLLEARRREQDAAVCVLLIDVDRFKQINDGHGHAAGDAALRGIGRALLGCTRDGDMVGRFGGDEFVALLTAEAGSGQVVAERMLHAVRDLRPPGLPVRVTVSIGVALAGPGRSVEQTLAAADRAMYVAKREGGDGVVVEG